MNNIYICEKPSQAKDLARILNLRTKKEGYYTNSQENIAITWAMGHLLELAPPDQYNDIYKKWNIDLLPIFPKKWKYLVKKGCNNQLKIILEGFIGKSVQQVPMTSAKKVKGKKLYEYQRENIKIEPIYQEIEIIEMLKPLYIHLDIQWLH